MRLAGVSTGAAVVSIFTADGIWQRAASPFVCLVHEAAGRISGAAGLGVTLVPGRLSWTRNSQTGLVLQGRYLLQPRKAQVTWFVTSLLGHIALIAFRAAVLVIATANSLR